MSRAVAKKGEEPTFESAAERLAKVVEELERGDLPLERALALFEEGVTLARRVTRNHRLWETYLITYADVAPSHVDRDADMVEHVLGPAMTRELEKILGRRDPDQQAELPSPHAMVEGRS